MTLTPIGAGTGVCSRLDGDPLSPSGRSDRHRSGRSRTGPRLRVRRPYGGRGRCPRPAGATSGVWPRLTSREDDLDRPDRLGPTDKRGDDERRIPASRPDGPRVAVAATRRVPRHGQRGVLPPGRRAQPVAGSPHRAAKEVCHRCPVMDLCREFALQTREPFGVWGGLAEAERRDHPGAAGTVGRQLRRSRATRLLGTLSNFRTRVGARRRGRRAHPRTTRGAGPVRDRPLTCACQPAGVSRSEA